MSLSGLLPTGLFTIDGLIGLVVTMIPVVILISLSVEFHVLGSGGSTEGFNPQAVRIIFVMGALLVILFKIDLPAPIPFDLGLGLGSDMIAMFPMYELGGLPFIIIMAIVMCAFISGIMVAVEGG